MLPSKIEDQKNLFKVKFEEIDDGTKPPKDTNRNRPLDLSFNPSDIPGFSNLIDSVYEAPQSFRNMFMNGISPTAIQTLFESGQSEMINKILSNFDLSNLLNTVQKEIPEVKTLYDYVHSEKKLNTFNLPMNVNPLNIFQRILNKVKQQKHKDYAEDFYSIVNKKRNEIYTINTSLFELINDKLSNLDEIKNKSYFEYIKKIFNSNDVYSHEISIHKQISNATTNLNLFYNYLDYELKENNRSNILNSYIEILNSIIDKFFIILKTEELNYIFEDLKELRKINETCEYSDI